MGRKKIEIRPLVEERNRNVTFLKRKAGLMKKAWELSVLCGAEVSIIIFSHAGKPYEFSSRELDGEIDRYLEYEGSIERRRAPEFAAMAAAGEDDDDDDEDNDRRGGAAARRDSKAGAGAGAAAVPAVPKSLKGKESFKPRMPTLGEVARAGAGAGSVSASGAGVKRRRSGRDDRDRDRDRGRDRDRDRERDREDEKRGFIEGLLASRDGMEDSDDDRDRYEEKPRQHSDLAALHYALNMHSQPLPPSSRSFRQDQTYPPVHNSTPLPVPQHPHPHQQPIYGQTPPMAVPSYSLSTPNQPTLSIPNTAPGQMQWDQNLLTKYAEFQLQQNHQRQQRILLEKQRQQLAELGIPIDDSGLLDQLFGMSAGGGGNGGGPSSQPQPQQQQQYAQQHQQHYSAQQYQQQQQRTSTSPFMGLQTSGNGGPSSHAGPNYNQGQGYTNGGSGSNMASGMGMGMGMGPANGGSLGLSAPGGGGDFMWPTFGRRQDSGPSVNGNGQDADQSYGYQSGVENHETGNSAGSGSGSGSGSGGGQDVLEQIYGATGSMGNGDSGGQGHGQSQGGIEEFRWPITSGVASGAGAVAVAVGGGGGAEDGSAYLPSPVSAEERSAGYAHTNGYIQGQGQGYDGKRDDRNRSVEGDGDYGDPVGTGREDIKRTRLYA